MRPESGQTETLWLATASILRHHKLDHNARANVCVIGQALPGS